MSFNPNSTVILCNVPIDNTYKNQLHFLSQGDQYTYFASRLRHNVTGCTTVRKTLPSGGLYSALRIGINIDSLYDSNYVMYQNANHGTKWFYAFIVDLVYVNESVTEVVFETDVCQTWMFEMSMKESFVVREHAASDGIGENLVDEGLELGEMVQMNAIDTGVLQDLAIVLGTTVHITEPFGDASGSYYDNLFSALIFSACTASGFDTAFDTVAALQAGKIGGLKCAFMFPVALFPCTLYSNTMSQPLFNDHSKTINVSFPKNNMMIGQNYTPRNKKLLTYPYNYLYVSNNNGGSAIYKYEFFSDAENATFVVKGNLSPNPTVKLIPLNYKGISEHWEEASTLGNYPMCSWKEGIWENWIAQNQNALNLAYLGGAVQIGTGAVSMMAGNEFGVSGVISGAMSIFNTMAETKKMQMQPAQAGGNIASGSVNLAHDKQDFTAYQYTITRDYAERIDKYFDMFGYKVGKVKVPQISNRPCWNYIQTIDCNITGPIPDKDMGNLKKMFNNGVTFWHDPTYVGNYSLDNSL